MKISIKFINHLLTAAKRLKELKTVPAKVVGHTVAEDGSKYVKYAPNLPTYKVAAIKAEVEAIAEMFASYGVVYDGQGFEFNSVKDKGSV